MLPIPPGVSSAYPTEGHQLVTTATRYISRRIVAPAFLVLALFVLVVAGPAAGASAATTGTDVVVSVGQLGATTYEQSLNGVLYTGNQILYTENQIGSMADRIVYVTQTSQNSGITVIYLAVSLVAAGMQNGGYLYQATLVPVAALPAGW